MSTLVKYYSDFFKYLFHRITVCINPKVEINRYFVKIFGHKANLCNPKSLIEKIYWMQIHCDTSSWSLFADKYRVREYIESKGYGMYLPKLYGVWMDPSEIIEDNLPMQCVIKTKNGCGSVFVIKDKSIIDWNQIKKELKHCLSLPFGYSGYQPHYVSIKPCVIAEELLQQNHELREISPDSMVDYKFWCFNGHVESCLVAYGRKRGNLYIDLYDTKWRRLRQHIKNFGDERIKEDICIPKPECLEKMLEIAKELSKGQPQMRVDMYIVNNQPVIGELTMSSGYGYFTEEYYNYLGKFVDISMLPKKNSK